MFIFKRKFGPYMSTLLFLNLSKLIFRCSTFHSDNRSENRMTDIKSLEHPTLKVPYEILNKRFRSAQKVLDR